MAKFSVTVKGQVCPAPRSPATINGGKEGGVEEGERFGARLKVGKVGEA